MFALPRFTFLLPLVAAAFVATAAGSLSAAPAQAEAGAVVRFIASACLDNIGDLSGLDTLASQRNWSKGEQGPGRKELSVTAMWDAEQDGERLRVVAGIGKFDDGDKANLCTVIFEEPKVDGIALHREIAASFDLRPVAEMKLPQGRIGLYDVRIGGRFGLTLQIVWMNDGTPVQASVIGPKWRNA